MIALPEHEEVREIVEIVALAEIGGADDVVDDGCIAAAISQPGTLRSRGRI
jgi:hypothetical protein